VTITGAHAFVRTERVVQSTARTSAVTMKLCLTAVGAAVTAREKRKQIPTIPRTKGRTAAEVTRLAETLAARGNPRLRGDADVAAILAAAAAQGAAELVAINLSSTPDDQRLTEARALAQEAHRRSDR